MTTSTDIITEARAWIADAFSTVDADELSEAEILWGVGRHYEGGVRGFLRDGLVDEVDGLAALEAGGWFISPAGDWPVAVR